MNNMAALHLARMWAKTDHMTTCDLWGVAWGLSELIISAAGIYDRKNTHALKEKKAERT